jgi:hypothetical protein
MSRNLFVATRKGLFHVEQGGPKDWKIKRHSFVGDPVTMLLDDPRDGALYAALNLGHFGVKLHRSEDRGESWTEVQAPSFPTEAADDLDATPVAPSVHQIWALEAGGASEPGVLWAGTIPGALFRSDDRGASWQLNRPLWDRPERANWFGGGYDDPGLHSICVDPRDAKHVTVAVSCGGVWVTDDSGETWTCKTQGMYAEYMPPERREDPDIQDPHRLVQCASAPDALWVQHHNGVFRSTSGAREWTPIETIEPSKFGFAVAVHPKDPDTAWFVPGVKDECRIPVGGQVVVARTRDGGKRFEVLRDGLPQEWAYDLVFRHALDVDSTGQTLAFGSTTGSIWVTEDGGDHWRTISKHLPPVYQVLFARGRG